jgi:hypothetical protein
MDLSPTHLSILERLVAARIGPITLPLYPNAICVYRDNFVAALLPSTTGGFSLLGEPGYLIDNKLAVAIERDGQKHFVFKQKSVRVTPELESQLQSFRTDLVNALA